MSVPAYPEYKHSGVPWLGAMPRHWEVAALKRKSRLVTLRADQRTFPVALENIEGWTGRFLPTETEFEGDGVAFEPGDILYGKLRPYLAKVLVALRGGEAIGDFHVIRPQGQDPQYVSYLLRTRELVSVVDGSTYGSKMPRANWDFLGALMIGYPPVEEQSAIAAFLDRETAKIDALVVEQERLIALLTEKRQAVISHAVTKGLNPDAPMKDSGIEWLGEIPAHWSVRPIRKLATLESGHTPSRSRPEFWVEQECTIPWVTTGDVKQLRDGRTTHLHTTAVKISQLGLANSSARLLPEDTVFLSRTASVGFSGIMADDMAVSQDFAAWICGDELLPAYLLFCLRSMSSVFASLMIGSTHKTIYMPDIEALVIPHPPVEEQQRIIDFILNGKVASEDLLDSCRTAITLLQERRAALISAAVTGKIDVRGEVSLSNVVALESVRPTCAHPALSAIVGTYAIRELGPMGRMAVMKAGYLAEAYAGLSDLNGRYERYAAGPYDRVLLTAMERGANELSGIITHEPRSAGDAVTYQVPSTATAPFDALRIAVGEEAAERFRSMLSLIKGIGRDGVEAVATIYAVWNDLLADKKDVSDDMICRGVLTDWHPEKATKFKRSDLDHWLGWMRRHGFTPDGTAPRTDHQGSLF